MEGRRDGWRQRDKEGTDSAEKEARTISPGPFSHSLFLCVRPTSLRSQQQLPAAARGEEDPLPLRDRKSKKTWLEWGQATTQGLVAFFFTFLLSRYSFSFTRNSAAGFNVWPEVL